MRMTVVSLFLLIILASSSSATKSIGEHNKTNAHNSKVGVTIYEEIPDLFPMGEDKITVIAQIITSSGFETREESIDLRASRQTILISNDKSSKTYLNDRFRGIVEYMPYSCKKISADEMKSDSAFSGLFTYIGQPWHTYGISAFWMNANYNSSILKPISDCIWEVDDSVTGNHIRIVASLIDSRYELESIQISSKDEAKIHTWINIISKEVTRNTDLLEVPTGYGCIIDDKPLALADLKIPTNYDDRFFASQLEISATKYNTNPQDPRGSSITDFIGLELLYSAVHGLQLVRRKDSTKDLKTVVDLKHRVSYELDELRGSCERHHNRKSSDSSSSDESHFLDTKITFSNGLSLDLSINRLKELFTNVDNFFLVKVIPNNANGYNRYYEAKLLNSEDIVVGYVTRRYYQEKSKSLLQLQSVSVRFLSIDHTQLEASYYFNIVDLVDPEDAQFSLIANCDQEDPRNPELGRQLIKLAKLFDVSEECYLESEKMRAGHDYIWAELSYMLPNQELRSLESQREQLEASLFGQLLAQWAENGLTLLRVPKFELIISLKEDLLIVRILILDMPSLNLIFTEAQNLLIKPMASYADQVDFARDLDHCTNLCRLNHCQLMSFGQRDHKCILSRRPAEEHTNETNSDYKTYYYEKIDDKVFDFNTLTAGSLRMIMRIIQSRQYDDYAIPAKDEAIQRPPDLDSGEYTLEEYRKMKEAYWQSLLDAMPTKEDRKLLFRFTAKSGLDHQLVPKTYLFEADPLEEFNLDDVDKNNLVDLEDSAPTFHRGFPFLKFKPDLPAKYQAHYFTGISVEQCELACVDGLCSSYSYCESNNRRECTLTNIHKFGSSGNDDATSSADIKDMEEVVGDNECFIAQRDFLSKYNRFENVLSPQTSGDIIQQTKVFNPSECAYQCLINSPKEPCLAFDLCIGSKGENADCFLLRKRDIYSGANHDDPTIDPSSKKPNQPDVPTGCDHYSRSYLADFWRIEYMEIKADELELLHPTTFTGLTVDSCADKCVTDDNKCTGFQFCFVGEHGDNTDNEMTQTCKLIDSPPKDELEIDEDENGNATPKGSFLIPSPGFNCHLFIMRSDAEEAKLRDLAFNGTKPINPNGGDDDSSSSTGLSLLSGLIIYICVTIVFAGLGSGFVILKHNSSRFRHQVERLSIYMRVRRS